MVSISPIGLLILLIVYVISYTITKRLLQDFAVPLIIALGVAYYTHYLVATLLGA